jgi:hypothetical protein
MLGTNIDLGLTFWDGERKLAGKRVDLLRGQNIPSNARTIDRTVGLFCVVSHKSTDLRCKSYKLPSKVYCLGTSFVRSIAGYKGEVRKDHKIKATYYLNWAVESLDSTRVLEWFVPLHGVTAEQEESLRRVVAYGVTHGVEVRVMRVP